MSIVRKGSCKVVLGKVCIVHNLKTKVKNANLSSGKQNPPQPTASQGCEY